MQGGFLSGYKTYIVAAMMVLQAFVRWAVTGEIELVGFLTVLFSPEVLTGFGLGFLRAGVKKSGG